MSVIVRDVSKRMGKNDVLRNVSIEVDPGTVVGLQGINGSGKTMLMRAVCGLIRPTEGEIIIDGQKTWGGYLVSAESGDVDRGAFLFRISVWLRQSGAHSSNQWRCHPRGHSLCPAARGARCRRKKRSFEHTRLG